MFDSLKNSLKKFAKGAEEAAKDTPAPPKPAPSKPPAPQAPARPAPTAKPPQAPAKPAPTAKPPQAPAKPASTPKPHVEVGRHDPSEKARAASEFDREIARAAAAPPGATPEHTIQGAEFEEGDRATVPTPPTREAPKASAAAAAVPKAALATAAKGKAIDPDKVADLLWDLELALLESDVALTVVEEIKARLEGDLPKIRVARTEDIPPAVEGALREALRAVLGKKIDWDEWILDRMAEKKPVVIMFVGVNGTGKTTAIGRLAHRLKEDGFSTILAAGDTFRAGAIEQLSRHGENLGVTVVKTQPGGDPAAVAYDAIEAAKARKKDVVLLDTAGRMQTNTNLMDEMKKIKRVAQPDMIVFVGDSLAGNDAVEQARQFDAAVGLDAAILTKVDTDAKGGAALSIAHAVGKPLLFLGVGQDYGDLIPYDPDWMVQRIFES